MQVVGEDEKSVPVGTSENEKHNMFDSLESPEDPNGHVDKDAEASSKPPAAHPDPGSYVKLNGDDYVPDDLVISPEEKNAFVEAMMTGDRYRQTIELFGGRVSVTIRSRTQAETAAMYSYIRRVAATKDGSLRMIEGDLSYITLVTQIEEVNGTRFPEMKQPYTYEESDGKTIEPGWMLDLKAWKEKPEGLTSALINRVQLFEYKYWLMVKEASNKNFWNSDTSIAG